MKVLAIGYGKNFFEKDNLERQRQISLAAEVDGWHAVVFSSEEDNLSTEVVSDHLTLYPTDSTNPVAKVRDAIRIGVDIIKQSGDSADWVITAQDPFEAGLVAWRISKILNVPFNVQEHGDFYSAPHWRRESLLNQVRSVYGKFILRKADTVRVVSKRIEQSLMRIGVDPHKISRLPVRTDISAFTQARIDRALIPQYDTQKQYILTVARFVSQKNLPLLVRAFARLLKEKPMTQLLLVGRGPLEQELRSLVDQLGVTEHVTFMPWTDQAPVLMKTVDVYALSSNYEGWGRVLIEATAAAVPIVTTDVGCAGESFLEGENIQVVPIGEEDAFVEALMHALNQTGSRTLSEDSLKALQSVSLSESEYAKAWTEILKKTNTSRL